MIIFLYGSDNYRSRKKLEEIIDEYKKKHKSCLNLFFFDALNKDFQDFFNQIKTSSMFGEKKLIVLRNLFQNKTFREDFSKKILGLKKEEEVIVLVYEDRELNKKDEFFQLLKKHSQSQEFSEFDFLSIRRWILEEFFKKKIRIEQEAQALLLNFVGNNLWQMKSEIEKLANYKKGGVVDKEDVKLLVKPKLENDIFKTIDALSNYQKKEALFLIQRHLNSGDNPLYLFSMIIYQFRNLLVVKEMLERGLSYSVIIKKSKLHPFVVKKASQICTRFSLSQLKKIYQKFFEIDIELKRGKIDPELALTLLISEI